MAKGAYKYEGNGFGWYWTRSPDSGSSDFAWYVAAHGGLDFIYVIGGGNGVRPGLWLNIAE